MLNCVALIPARGGSKRVPNKNIKSLAGHPLLAYTIAAAKQAMVTGFIKAPLFASDGVYVSTESDEIAEIAQHYGARVIKRPAHMARDSSPDIDWVRHALHEVPGYQAFMILRPTSPFRQPATIERAWREFQGSPDDMIVRRQFLHSLRAVEPCRQHPGKMWFISHHPANPCGGVTLMQPVLSPEFHSRPTQSLPTVYAQNASLECAWTWVPEVTGTIAGSAVMPFLTEGYEGFDVNTPDDWLLAEVLIERGLAKLPEVKEAVAA